MVLTSDEMGKWDEGCRQRLLEVKRVEGLIESATGGRKGNKFTIAFADDGFLLSKKRQPLSDVDEG